MGFMNYIVEISHLSFPLQTFSYLTKHSKGSCADDYRRVRLVEVLVTFLENLSPGSSTMLRVFKSCQESSTSNV